MLQKNKNQTSEKAHEISYHPKDRMVRFRKLSLSERSAVFERLSPHIQQSILDKLRKDELLDLLDHFDLQQAENILARVKNETKRRGIAILLKTELKEKAEYFTRFHPDAALNLLNFNYLLLPETATVSEVADGIEEHYKEVGKLPEVLIHRNGDFLGEVPASALVRESNINRSIEHYVVPIKSVTYQAEIKEIIDALNGTKHGKVVVLDTDGSVVGIIYTNDVMELFSAHPAADLYDFAGVAESERPFDSVGKKVKRRYRWLMINLATAFLAALVVGLFQNTLDQIVVLAIYMPVIAGMGSNTATQTLAVISRGIAIGEIKLKNGMPAILREVGAGSINGIINGFLVFLIATFWNQNPLLGLIVGVSMFLNLVVGGFFGAFIPLFMKSIGKDPATSATIFITTATDVFGFFVFLGLATIVLL